MEAAKNNTSVTDSTTMRRGLRRTCVRFKRNRPSGLVVLFLVASVIAYTAIVKLDSTKYVKTSIHNSTAQVIARHLSPVWEKARPNDIPINVLEDFRKDSVDNQTTTVTTIDATNEAKGDVEDTTEILTLSENEMLLNGELEANEDEIDNNWSGYLNRSQTELKHQALVEQKYTQNHMMFQGIMIDSSSKHKAKNTTDKLVSKLVKLYDVFKESRKTRDSIKTNKCILLKTLHGDSPICVHDPDYDELISAHVLQQGTWEPNYLYITGSILKLNPYIRFLDLGCNIGVYTILAAKLGKKVVSVDPNKSNLRLLTKSLSLGNIRSQVTLLWNAISNVNENVTLKEYVGNVGGAYVETAKDTSRADEEEDVIGKAVAITLDELVPFFVGESLFLKMDIETYEWKALQGGSKLFEKVNVQFVLMEWIYFREADTGKDIIQFMDKHGLYPHVNAHHNTKLEPEHRRSWPDNVLWIRY